MVECNEITFKIANKLNMVNTETSDADCNNFLTLYSLQLLETCCDHHAAAGIIYAYNNRHCAVQSQLQ